ncbi:hypothetical protein KIH41_01570 [Litoribacter ruber]|uniref:DUF748 domain-containing protein n=1 Tax=Litoribacter ruber TaxID=702568 RepID=A0AAP2CHI4_9BACT|nr:MULTISPECIES: hypothetical protein [Litoribacter]MBS9524237.1 hypothetical protein [Litoribacter alkaliphilus]MBT0809965.1 hypothetical protein [Litoribacter ruber]
MTEKTPQKLQLSDGQRKFLRYFLIFIGTILFLQVTVYFTSDFLLRRYIKEQVEIASDGKYTIDFKRFYLSLLERGFYVEGFTLVPSDETLEEEKHLAFHRIEIPEFSIKGINYRFGDKILVLGTIRLTEPMIQSRLQEMEEEERGESPLRMLEQEIRKSVGGNLEDIIIRDLYVDNADLLLENFISQQSIKAEKTHFHVANIQILKEREIATPFNAEGFDFQMDNFELLLADSIHTIKANHVDVSSLESYIKGQQVRLVPDVTSPSEIYYQVELDFLELTDADINKVFYTSEVEVGRLALNYPKFSIFSDVVTDDAEGAIEYDLYPLIQDILASISVENMDIYKGSYLQRSIRDTNRNRVEAGSIDFKMVDVYIGPDEEKKRNQFFHARDAALDISDVKIALADGVHWVTGQKVLLSSFDDAIEITGVKVFPIDDEGETPDITLFEIDVPSLSLSDANLKKIYNENIVDIKEMIINEPSVLLKDVRAGDGDQNLAQTSLQELTREFLRAIYVERLEMRKGNLVLDNRLRLRQDSLAFGEINFVLENFRLDEDVDSQSSRIFFAEDLQLEIQDYALKLSDNLHMFTSDRLYLDTKENFLQINGFKFRPADPNNIQENLNRYEINSVLDIEIPEFSARGIDIPSAYFRGELLVNQIEVPSPVIKLTQYRKGEGREDREETDIDKSDIYDLLTTYFSVIKVDSLNLIAGTWEYENLGQDRIRTFAEDNVSIRVKNFYLDQYSGERELQSFFAEELDISLDNYVFNLAEGQYSIIADKISFNSAREEILTTNVRLRPRRNIPAKVSISADIPEMSFGGVDLETFVFDNELSLQKVKLTDTDVRLFINRDEEREDRRNGRGRRGRDRNLPRTIDVVQIDTIEAENAHINVAYRIDGVSRELIDTGINLKFFNFLLDSTKLTHGEIAEFFGNMEASIDDFSLVLQDSIHSINFAKVDLNTQDEEIVFTDLALTPINTVGQPGRPVISAAVPRVVMKTESLNELQQTGEFIISSLKLDDPVIALYLDNGEKTVKKVEKTEEALQQILTNLYIGRFEIGGGKIQLLEKGTAQDIQTFSNLGLVLSDLNFDLTRMGELDTKFFLNSDYEVVIPNYELELKDSLNVVRVGLAKLNGDQLILDDVRMFPKVGKYEYIRKVGHQTDVATVHIPQVVFDGLDLNKFVEDKKFVARRLELHDLSAEVFRDKRFEIKEGNYRPMPQKLMMNAGIDVTVDSLIMSKANIRYHEFPSKGMVPGNIQFNDMDISIAPFQLTENPDNYEFQSSELFGKGFMNEVAPMEISGTMYFFGDFPMKVRAQTGEFELALINPILETNAFATARRGTIEEAHWEFIADDNSARGEMTVQYRKLNLRLLDERTLEQGTGRKRILSWVINAIAVRSNNPRRLFNNLVTSTIYEPRDDSRFIFNYWWRATLSGLKGSVGLGQPRIPKEEEMEIVFPEEP